MAKKKPAPKPEAFNKGKFLENVKKLLDLVIKVAPLIFGEGHEPLRMAALAEGKGTKEGVEAQLVAALADLPKVEPGKMGGPILSDALRKALYALVDLGRNNVEAAVDIFERIVEPRLPDFLNI